MFWLDSFLNGVMYNFRYGVTSIWLRRDKSDFDMKESENKIFDAKWLGIIEKIIFFTHCMLFLVPLKTILLVVNKGKLANRVTEAIHKPMMP